MSSRYPPTRDRSPPRHFDRRPSATYTPTASTYRGTGDPQASSLDRPPPRGPKADFRGGGYQFAPASRGRGNFPSRASDTWDRDRERDRDPRAQPPPYRRDDERGDWPRRDREFPQSDRSVGPSRERTYVGRDRSASPERARRNSRESLPSTFNRPAETASSYYSPATRGGPVRGRGRGDWDRGRGRSSFVSERDREFHPRSRSREEWRDRDYDRGRPAGPDGERGDRFDRREYDRPDDREVRGREHDVWPRDRSPGRNSTGRPASPGAMSTISQHGDRYKTDYDAGRKHSLAGPLSARSEGRRDADADYFSSRVETPRRDGPLSQQFPALNMPQSSSVGLDYGDPPSVPATTPSVQEKPPPLKPQPIKVDASVAPPAPLAPSAPAALQPPSGPKADRVPAPPNAPSTPRAATQQFEQWPKSESASRPLRPGPVGSSTSLVNESNLKSADTPTSAVADRPLPANVPSGPRATSGNFRARLLSNEQAAPNAPLTAPRQPKASILENRPVPNAPTGPRSSTFPGTIASHNVPPTGPQAGSNRQWVAPDYRPSKPSIMNQLNKPYQPDVRERSSISGPSSRPGGVIYQSQQAKPKITQPMTAESASQMLSAKAIGSMVDTPSGAQTPMDEDMVDSPIDVEMSLPASDEEDMEDDDGLDEDYFAASEETHIREMRLLESKKPLSPLFDPTTAALIVRIQLLGMLAYDIVPEAYDNVRADIESAMDLDPAPVNAPPSPEHTPEERTGPAIEHPRPRGRPLSQAVVNPIPTPPIDELPYLNDALGGCHVLDERDVDSERDTKTLLLCQNFEHDAWEEIESLEEMHLFYKSRYPQWKREIEQADQRLREVHQPSPAPASPAPSATPSLPTAAERAGGERTRGARNTTDLDMQQAILMSQQSAKEEEERREREAASNALPNYEIEAVVPFMIKPLDIEMYYFEDTNKQVDHESALDVYGFVPPEDDFTDEEQAAFIAAYCQTPKKWGKIADSIPGRTYQDCIAHYYLTKDTANYKEHWRRSQPKRGRRRAANVKPRANNLMSDLALNEEGEGTPVAVTDSGRPRRAAAPTFGDATDPDAASAPPQAKRLKDSIKDGDPNQPKARGRKGAGAGKGRKAKDKIMVDPATQILLPAGTNDASPQKMDRNFVSKDKAARSSKVESSVPPKVEPSYGPPVLTAPLPLDLNKIGSVEVHSNNAASVPPQANSYWSVPEQQKFPQLIQYFGRDFTAIAGFLKTKSAIMIKNYFQREVQHGKLHLEEYASIADEKRAKGEPMGPEPSPVPAARRRYDPASSMAGIPRTAGNSVDANHQMPEPDSGVPAAKAIIEEFPSNSVQRVAGEVVAKPRQPRELVHHTPVVLQVHPKVEDTLHNDRPAVLQKTLQGPPRGLFHQEEPIIFSQPQPQHHHQKLQAPTQESSPHLRPTQTTEHRSMEGRPQTSTQQMEIRGGEFARSLLPHNRDQLGQPHQPTTAPQYQTMSDRNLHHTSRVGHGRHGSLATSQTSHEQAAADLASLRNMDVSRGMTYGMSTGQSPMSVPIQTTLQSNLESSTAARPAAVRPEPPKPVPAKRSNVFKILNDDPPEPPVKKLSVESAHRSAVNTPPPQSMSAQPPSMQQRLQDELGRSSQPSYNQIGRTESNRTEYRQDYSSSPAQAQAQAQGHPADVWLDRWDPRQQGQPHEQRQSQQSPAPGSYSVVPPTSQSSPVSSMPNRYDPARGIESSTHRRSLLAIGHAPSPPPQQQQQTAHLHRTSSGSSQHGRGTSVNYKSTTTSSGAGYPLTTSSTPVTSLHHRSQPSIDNPPPLTIQQYLKEQEQAKHTHRRDIDITHQHQATPSTQPQLAHQPPSQPPSRASDRRDMYNSVSEPRSNQPHHVPTLSSQTPQSQPLSMSYSTAPPSRTFTPPHPAYGPSTGLGGHSHSHHTHQPQYQSHQSPYSHTVPQGPTSQHHQSYQGHPGYGPPPSTLPHQRNVHPLGTAQQTQQGHYRGYSADDRR